MEHYYQIVEYVTGTGSNLLPVIFAAIAGGMGKIWHTVVQERKYMREHELAMKQEMKRYEGEKHERDERHRGEMLSVLRENTAAIAANKQVVENFLKMLEKHGEDSREVIKRVHERIEGLGALVSEMRASLAKDILDDAKKMTEAEVSRLIKLTEGEIARLIKRLDDIAANTARHAAH